MEQVKIRLLQASEIECRVGSIGEKGLSLLLFKDARVDQKILDETFTPFGWRRTHQSIDGNLYCTVEIWDESKQQWIAKQDVGTTSYSEKEKGQASDSFKRACFNWGLGRELYTAPFIWIPAQRTDIQKREGRYVVCDKFVVKEISYNQNREISALVIVNQRGTIVFSMGKGKEEIRVNELQIQSLEKELERTGISMNTVLSKYRLQAITQMTVETYEALMNGLGKSRSKAAA